MPLSAVSQKGHDQVGWHDGAVRPLPSEWRVDHELGANAEDDLRECESGACEGGERPSATVANPRLVVQRDEDRGAAGGAKKGGPASQGADALLLDCARSGGMEAQLYLLGDEVPVPRPGRPLTKGQTCIRTFISIVAVILLGAGLLGASEPDARGFQRGVRDTIVYDEASVAMVVACKTLMQAGAGAVTLGGSRTIIYSYSSGCMPSR